MRASWAKSAQLHDKFGQATEKDMSRVLEDYGLDVPEMDSDEPLVIIDRKDLSPAVAALVALVEAKPEALALVIKYHKAEFKSLYEEELAKRSES